MGIHPDFRVAAAHLWLHVLFQTNIAPEWAKGSWVKDSITGRTYLDLICNVGVQSTGHVHPKFVILCRALREITVHFDACLAAGSWRR